MFAFTIAKINKHLVSYGLTAVAYGVERSEISIIIQGILLGLLLSSMLFKFILQRWEVYSSSENSEVRGHHERGRSVVFYGSLAFILLAIVPLWMQFVQDFPVHPFLCFGDYVSDQVVAPVRETCAQALGAVLKYMPPLLVHETLNILLKMQRRPEWEIRHGSLLGIKYLVAVHQEMLPDLLGRLLSACKAGLEDPDDDVRAVAADALLPAASSVVSLSGEMLHSIVMLLWDILLDLDDLSPSTSSVMYLLADIYSLEAMITTMFSANELKVKQGFDLNEIVSNDDFARSVNSQENPYMLSTLAPRLWPFMRHSITSVRYSAIRTLERLLEAEHRRSISESSCSFWPSFILVDTLRIVFQNLLLDSNQEIL